MVVTSSVVLVALEPKSYIARSINVSMTDGVAEAREDKVSHVLLSNLGHTRRNYGRAP